MGLVLVTAPALEPLERSDVKDHLRITATDEHDLLDAMIVAARRYAEDIGTHRQLLTATWRRTLDHFPAVIELPRPPLQAVTSIKYVDSNGTIQTLGAWGDRAVNFTAVAATDILTASGHELVTCEPVQVSSTTTLPAGLAASTVYYARNLSATTLTLHTTAGGALNNTGVVDITDTGTGTHSLLIGNTLYLVDRQSEPARITPTYSNSWPTIREQIAAIQVNYIAGYGDLRTDVPAGIRQAMKMLVAHWYEHREAYSDEKVNDVPLAVESLFWQHKIARFT